MTQVPGERDASLARDVAAGATPAGRAGRRLGLAQFTLQLDFSIVNVALATIQREFGVSAADLQWIVTGYALPFGALLLLGGRLGDLTGHRRLLVTGLGLLPATLTVLVTATWLARRLAGRFGARAVLAAGLVSIGLGQVWLAQLSASGSYLVNVLPGIALTAFGMGLLFPTASVVATAGVASGDRGLAGGLLAASQQVGMAVGLAVLATIAAARTHAVHGSAAAALVSGYRLSYWVAAAIVACDLAMVLFLLRDPARDNSK